MKLAIFEEAHHIHVNMTNVLSINTEEAKMLIPCGKNIIMPCNRTRRESDILAEILAEGTPCFGAQKKILLERL
jgi:hypothetical protein